MIGPKLTTNKLRMVKHTTIVYTLNGNSQLRQYKGTVV